MWYNTNIQTNAGRCWLHPRRGQPIEEVSISTIPSPRFYVYVLARPNSKPFYVGKGTGQRVYNHDIEARGGHECYKCRVIRKIWRNGGQVQRYIVFTTDNEQEAFDYERELIALYGRETLTNLTDGGEGMSGHKYSDESRHKMSESHKGQVPWSKGKPVSEDHRRKISATLKGRPLAPHVREMLIRVNTAREYSQEQRDNIALGQTNGRLYTIVSPDGTAYEHVVNILDFAREHTGGSKAGLWRAVNGQRKQYRGWRGWPEGTEPPTVPTKTAYTIIAPDGTRYTGITNPNAFARNHGLDGHQLRTVLRGDRQQYKGWTGYRE